MDQFEFMGYWWLPNKEEDKVPGKLIFNPRSDARLELLGNF